MLVMDVFTRRLVGVAHSKAQRQRNGPMVHSVLPPTFIAMLGNCIVALCFRRPPLPDYQFATDRRTSGLYDRRNDGVGLDQVERILI